MAPSAGSALAEASARAVEAVRARGGGGGAALLALIPAVRAASPAELAAAKPQLCSALRLSLLSAQVRFFLSVRRESGGLGPGLQGICGAHLAHRDVHTPSLLLL